mmetsp:Transcript_2959/g.7821  ORF Transcript_2959/g.7821 Transcript_2959/m.7821 type:complete len:399 (+) Transcript_2959:1213-2409(+)
MHPSVCVCWGGVLACPLQSFRYVFLFRERGRNKRTRQVREGAGGRSLALLLSSRIAMDATCNVIQNTNVGLGFLHEIRAEGLEVCELLEVLGESQDLLDGGERVVVLWHFSISKPFQCLLHGGDADAEERERVDAEFVSDLRLGFETEDGGLAALEHVGEHGFVVSCGKGAHLAALVFALQGVNEHHVGANLAKGLNPPQSFLHRDRLAAVGPRDDDNPVLRFRGLVSREASGPHPGHGINAGHHRLVLDVAAALGDHLVLKEDAGDARVPVSTQSPLRVEGVAISVVSVDDDGDAGDFHARPCRVDHLRVANELAVRTAELRGRGAEARQKRDVEAAPLDEKRAQSVVGTWHRDAPWHGQQLAQPARARRGGWHGGRSGRVGWLAGWLVGSSRASVM